MTPLEFRHEIASIKALGEAGVERLEGLYHRVEDALEPREVICGRCKNVRELEADFPDQITKTRLRIGSGIEAEFLSLTPLTGALIDRLVVGRGKIQTYETLIFHAYETGVNRIGQQKGEPEEPSNTIKVIICKFRKRLEALKQNVRIETRHGQGYVLVSDVPEIVLEAH